MSSYIGNEPAATTITQYLGAFRNLILNGPMDFDQRGGGTLYTSVAAGIYTLDRWFGWRTSGTVGGQVQQIAGAVQAAGAATFLNSLKMSRLAGNAGVDPINLNYSAETKDCLSLVGQPLTLSFVAKAGANLSGPFTYSVLTGTGTDERSTAYTGSATLLTGTAALTTTPQLFVFNAGAVPTNVREIGIKFSMSAPAGTAGADDSVSITGVQLEPGVILSPTFERRPQSLELLSLQRYFEKSYDIGVAVGAISSNGIATYYVESIGSAVHTGRIYVRFVTKRTAPTVTAYSDITGVSGKWRDTLSGADANASAASIGQGGCLLSSGQAGTLTAVSNTGHWAADAEI